MSFYKLAKRYAEASDVDLALVLAIIHEESRGIASEISSDGEHFGLMQLGVGAAKDGGLEEEMKGMSDSGMKAFLLKAENNIRGGTGYLARLLRREALIVPELALLGHRAGPKKVRQTIRAYARMIDSPVKGDLELPSQVAAFILSLPPKQKEEMVEYVIQNTPCPPGTNFPSYMNKVQKRTEEYRQLLNKL